MKKTILFRQKIKNLKNKIKNITLFSTLITILIIQQLSAQVIKPLRPVTATTGLRRVYLPLKVGFRQLRISPLPTLRTGRLDTRSIVLKASVASSESLKVLNRNQKSKLNLIVKSLKQRNTNRAKVQWKQLVNSFKNGSVPADITALTQRVLRQAYLEASEDLQFYASKVKHINKTKESVREYLNDLRAQKRACVKYTNYLKSSIDLTISNYEDKLALIGDDAQLANIDLQNILQKQQHLIQMMSNISKLLHDTALSVIRKIG